MASASCTAVAASPPLSLTVLPQPFAESHGAACLDGSPPAFYSLVQDPTKWVLFIEVGAVVHHHDTPRAPRQSPTHIVWQVGSSTCHPHLHFLACAPLLCSSPGTRPPRIKTLCAENHLRLMWN